ncbi:protein FAM50 homolog isoform X2 [Convolutriloba macropyga]
MKAKQTQIIKNKETEMISRVTTDTSTFKCPEPGLYTAAPTGSLSFNFDDEEEDENDDEDSDSEIKSSTKELSVDISVFKKFKKNPNVDTSFLPDTRRDEEEGMLRERLMKEWVERQQRMKDQVLKIEFSYWDGSGHKREMLVKKGVTIHQFLYKCLEQLRAEGQFPELRSISVDQLMFVKDDMILPHHSSFYDLIMMKAQGKNGNLIFNFPETSGKAQSLASSRSSEGQVERESEQTTSSSQTAKPLGVKSTAEKVDNAKVALRHWYDKNKHIYPASRWDAFDPEKMSQISPPNPSASTNTSSTISSSTTTSVDSKT